MGFSIFYVLLFMHHVYFDALMSFFMLVRYTAMVVRHDLCFMMIYSCRVVGSY